MPACDARYDVVLFDGHCPGYSHGIPKDGTPMPTAFLDYEEERAPDVFGDPGRLIGARYRGGATPRGEAVREVKRYKQAPRFRIDGKGDPHWIMAYERRYLRWAWIEPDPPIDPLYEDPA